MKNLIKKLFEPSPLQQWYNSLPNHTKKHVDAQPVWHDKDMRHALIVGLVVGFILGNFI